MAERSTIEWTDATWNPVTGCAVVSPGCTNCYAMRLAGTRLRHHPSRAGLTRGSKAGPVWTGEVRLNEQWLDQPLRWKRPRRIFVCAHGDLFAESVPDEWIDSVFAVMDEARRHTFQVLTKRARRMRDYVRHRYELPDRILASYGDLRQGRQPPRNVWLGVSVEDQTRAEERVPALLDTPAAVRFVSAEPLLGAIEFTAICAGHHFIDALRGIKYHDAPEDMVGARQKSSRLDQIIVGGESGEGARPMHPQWVRDIRDDCAIAGTAFFFKQWGSYLPAGQMMSDGRMWSPNSGNALHAMKSLSGRYLDGVEHDAMPGAAP